MPILKSFYQVYYKCQLSLLALLLISYASVLAQQHQAKEEFTKEYNKLTTSVHKIIYEQRFVSDTSALFTIKLKANAANKITAVEYSQNFPAQTKENISRLLRDNVKWSKLKPAGECDIIVPLYYIVKESAGTGSLTPITSLLERSFRYSGDHLFNNKVLKNVMFMEPLLYTTSREAAPVDRMIDSSDLKKNRFR